MAEEKLGDSFSSYAQKIEILSVTKGDPEVYYNEFKISLQHSIVCEEEAEQRCQTATCFNPGFLEFLSDTMRRVLCCMICPCCLFMNCWDLGRGSQPSQSTRKTNVNVSRGNEESSL